MGCCGDEDDDILRQLITDSPPPHTHNHSSENSSQRCSSSCVISPMNSNFSALISKDILRSIFERLPLSDLARAACVCRLWNLIASDREMRTRVFKSPWQLKDVIGNPSSRSFWCDNGLHKFAFSHRLVRGDTVASLAVKYSVQVMDLKRLNNMMSDHGIHSRERLLIPINNPEALVNSTCYIELDSHAKREVAVLYPEGRPNGKLSYLSDRTNDREKSRILETIKKSMHTDDATMRYYLSVSNGDLRAAFSTFSDDLKWEQQQASTSTLRELLKS
ncbi:F-box protein At1g55000 [Aristolochia californica]|uniref:F-box protein At1g55000 n=1 Tax=Aristolochia californica TaxID=171875 RepID=UPI0035E26E6D